MAFHPTKRLLFVVHEMGNLVSVHSIGASGELTQIQELPTNFSSPGQGLSKAETGDAAAFSKAGEIQLTADGRSVFIGNRGYGTWEANSIAGYSVNTTDGTLTSVGLVRSNVTYPRGLELTPDGTLLAAGQGNGKLMAFDVAPGGKAGTLGNPRLVAAGLATPTTIAFG
jgi:6-phosphogluconolactonase (cycloisomerase 2 family)